MRSEVYRVPETGGNTRWEWKLTDHRGTVVAYADGYATRRECETAVESLMASIGILAASQG